MSEYKKEKVSYLVSPKETVNGERLYISNKPYAGSIKLSNNRNEAREFTGLEQIDLEFENYNIIKKTEIEITKYEVYENE